MFTGASPTSLPLTTKRTCWHLLSTFTGAGYHDLPTPTGWSSDKNVLMSTERRCKQIWWRYGVSASTKELFGKRWLWSGFSTLTDWWLGEIWYGFRLPDYILNLSQGSDKVQTDMICSAAVTVKVQFNPKFQWRSMHIKSRLLHQRENWKGLWDMKKVAGDENSIILIKISSSSSGE